MAGFSGSIAAGAVGVTDHIDHFEARELREPGRISHGMDVVRA
jgi:hypothetical protein